MDGRTAGLPDSRNTKRSTYFGQDVFNISGINIIPVRFEYTLVPLSRGSRHWEYVVIC